MPVKGWCWLLIAALGGSFLPSTAEAKFEHAAVGLPAGVVVHHSVGDGVIDTDVSVPGGSAFHRGSSRAVRPCGTYRYLAKRNDPLHPFYTTPVDQLTSEMLEDKVVQRVSKVWEFDEVLNTTPVGNEPLLRKFLVNVDHDYLGWRQYKDNTQPLADLMRRFSVHCRYPSGTGTGNNGAHYQGTVDVSALDVFFDVEQEAARLRSQLRTDTIEVHTNPERSTFGGLVVNMPTHLSIGETPWTIYWTEGDANGMTLTQVAAAAELEFTVVQDPKGDGDTTTTTVECIGRDTEVRRSSGKVPARDAATPDFETEDPDMPCVWLPTRVGTATITARVTYDVAVHLVLFGVEYTLDQAPYVWESAPYQIDIGEIRIVNVIPD